MKKKGAGVLSTLGTAFADFSQREDEEKEWRKKQHEMGFSGFDDSKGLASDKISSSDFAEAKAFYNQLQKGQGRRKTKKLRRKFDKCVRAVRKTVKARRGSTKKQAAYAICTKTILSK